MLFQYIWIKYFKNQCKNCKMKRCKDSSYCIKHKCNKDICNKEKLLSEKTDYCIDHKCVDCNKEKDLCSIYCYEHKRPPFDPIEALFDFF